MTSKIVVTVEQGQVEGKTATDYLGESYYSFLGIPYAKSPVGDLRFKAPVPPEPWEGVRNATKEASECPATHMFFGYNVGSEQDCLNLNISTKELPKSDGNNTLKPVMVWIHGGAFLYGSNKAEFFGPDYLMIEDIVFVSINYRLGVFGFLCLDDTSLEVPGNAGLKDMVMALKWVQKNISRFGGDPNNVTIFGESAGAASVHYLLLSPLAKGLFHKAIAQSGCSLNCWAHGKSNGKQIAKHLGYSETQDEKKILEYLRKQPIHKLIKSQLKGPDDFSGSTIRDFCPVVEKVKSDTAFLTDNPLDLIKSGNYNQVPLIMGYNSNEGLFFEIVKKVRSDVGITKNFELEIPHDLNLKPGTEQSLETANKIKQFYFQQEEPSEKNVDRWHSLKSDTQFLHAIHRSINYQKLNSTTPIYLYRLSLESSLNYFRKMSTVKSLPLLFFSYYLSYKTGDYSLTRNAFLKLSNIIPSKAMPGVSHGDDLGYLFNSFLSLKVEANSIEDVAIRRFVKLWTNFARTGNPTPNPNDELLKVEWKPVEKDTTNFLQIGKELTVNVNPDEENMKFWDSIYGNA